VLDEVLASRRVVAVVGSGGVGKTTLSAALGVRAALQGRKVLVLTIDPARRLANSLGLSTLGNVETRIPDEAFRAAGLEPRGELWAMTLDLRRGWDDLIERYAPSRERRDKILQNPLYKALSTQMVGSLEYMAMEKVHQLEAAGGYDLVVLDTPPTAHALDFIDAPNRLLDLLSHDAARWLLGGAGGAGRLGLSFVQLGSGYVTKTLSRFTGTELLQGLADFFVAFQDMFDGFKERAAATKALLSGPKSAFVLVTSPHPMTVDEAVFFAGELQRAGISVAAGIVNRVHDDPLAEGGAVLAPDIALALAKARIPNGPVPHLSTRLERTIAEFSAMAARDAGQVEQLRTRTGRAFPIHRISRMSRDVHDLAGLWQVSQALREVRAPEARDAVDLS
jgi:anion-transporting  ArsA/GET3 family ATPase